ncbi:hypothetical protein [Geobacter pickeringii]|uniref:Uncharacterized protein n=1 Tax=Geobacter pickeringii TaxID=345632 RepID=A0A0B5BFV6_9BACT|nr:hypothetical protein [Geobacter pickeringii]AJE03400.1 hypothetical protein GPICK_08575 [Geobacter pickeringii]
MKNLMVLSFVSVLTIAVGAAAYAAPITTSTTLGTTTTFTPSSNVQVDAWASNSAYAATSQHLSGNRIFFGMNGDSKIYFNTKTAGSQASVSIGSAGAPATTVPTGYTTL